MWHAAISYFKSFESLVSALPTSKQLHRQRIEWGPFRSSRPGLQSCVVRSHVVRGRVRVMIRIRVSENERLRHQGRISAQGADWAGGPLPSVARASSFLPEWWQDQLRPTKACGGVAPTERLGVGIGTGRVRVRFVICILQFGFQLGLGLGLGSMQRLRSHGPARTP